MEQRSLFSLAEHLKKLSEHGALLERNAFMTLFRSITTLSSFPRWIFLCFSSIVFSLNNSPAHSAEIELLSRQPPYCAVMFEGPIVTGDFDRFSKAIERGWLKKCLRFQINLFSPGGNLVEAIKIGRLIRIMNANTSAPRKTRDAPSCGIFKKKYGTECICASACAFIWIAGVRRSGDRVLVHRPYFSEQLDDPYSDVSQQAYRDAFNLASEYMQNLTVPQSVIEKMLYTASSDAALLSASELQVLRTDPIIEELEIRACGPEDKNPKGNAAISRAINRLNCATAFEMKNMLPRIEKAIEYIAQVRAQ